MDAVLGADNEVVPALLADGKIIPEGFIEEDVLAARAFGPKPGRNTFLLETGTHRFGRGGTGSVVLTAFYESHASPLGNKIENFR